MLARHLMLVILSLHWCELVPKLMSRHCVVLALILFCVLCFVLFILFCFLCVLGVCVGALDVLDLFVSGVTSHASILSRVSNEGRLHESRGSFALRVNLICIYLGLIHVSVYRSASLEDAASLEPSVDSSRHHRHASRNHGARQTRSHPQRLMENSAQDDTQQQNN